MIPIAVVTNAIEIEPAINFGSPVPNSVIAWKVRIIPVTVPSRPSRGATPEINLMVLSNGLEYLISRIQPLVM